MFGRQGLQGIGQDFNTAENAGAMFTWVKGPRFWHLRGELEEIRRIECDLHVWRRPVDGADIIVRVDLLCPNCGFPLTISNRREYGIEIENGMLSCLVPIQCHAFWPDAHGNNKKCGWKGIIREGKAHNPNCPAANYQNHHSPSNCRCGAYPNEAERKNLMRRT